MLRDALHSARPFVKVCGLTRIDDLELCAKAGADAAGIVRYEHSPRHVGDEKLCELGPAARELGLSPILVTLGITPAEAEELALQAGLLGVQLCGDEDPSQWEDFSLPLLRRVGVAPGAQREFERWKNVASAFVLDAPGSPGGSGQTVDQELATALASGGPSLLAGGLDGPRVASLSAPLREALIGYDASSRLEDTPGSKCEIRVRAFVDAARHTHPAPRK